MDYDLKLGDRLDIVVGNIKCPTKLEEITPDGTLIISEPRFRSPVLKGDTLTLMFYRRGGMYSCSVLVTRKLLDRERSLALLEIEIRSHLLKYQRREYVRFSVSLAVNVLMLCEPESAHQADVPMLLRELESPVPIDRTEDDKKQKANILDISGGGLRIALRKRIPAGALIGCEFRLGESEPIHACCLVMNEDYQECELPFRVGCRFASIGERSHRRIIRYIFDEQIKRPR